MTSRVDRNSSAASHHVAVSLRKAFVRNTIRDRANQPPCGIAVVARGRTMRELEASLQQFSEFILRVRLAKENAAPYFVRWVPRFLTRPASNEPLADQVRTFCEGLEHEGRWADWQVRQAEHALRIYFVHFLKRTDWQTRPPSTVDERGHASPLAARTARRRIRTRHYSYRTECTYVDWVRRFLDYLIERQGAPHPRVESRGVRDFATHLAVHRRVSASTQNPPDIKTS
jgi:hypothetical protein